MSRPTNEYGRRKLHSKLFIKKIDKTKTYFIKNNLMSMKCINVYTAFKYNEWSFVSDSAITGCFPISATGITILH